MLLQPCTRPNESAPVRPSSSPIGTVLHRCTVITLALVAENARNRLSAGDAKRLAGVTGASVGAGRTLKVTADLADALIDAGYEIRIDAAAEDMRDSPSDIRVPLTTQNAGKPQAGKQYVQSLTYQLK